MSSMVYIPVPVRASVGVEAALAGFLEWRNSPCFLDAQCRERRQGKQGSPQHRGIASGLKVALREGAEASGKGK